MSLPRNAGLDRWRWPLAIAGVVLLAAVVGALTVPRGTRGALDPDSPAPTGTRALAQVLRDRGVAMERVRTSLDAAAAGPDATLVVVHTLLLGPEQLARVARSRADLVLVEPDALALGALVPTLAVAGVDPPLTRSPGCTDPAAAAAGAARAGGHLYTGADCYAGSYAVVPGRSGGRSVRVIGQSELLTNAHLAEDGNAALALWTLGARSRLVWYLPDPLELSASQAPTPLRDLLPRWVVWGAVQLVIAAGLALAWRARRLGPLVTEPLPVVVRSVQTHLGRARLYRQAGARGRAAGTLRTAALRRLAGRLDVPAEATIETAVGLIAAASGRPDTAVRALLAGPPPADDAALVALADDLDALGASIGASAPTVREVPST